MTDAESAAIVTSDVGEDPRTSAAGVERYRQLRDLRSGARDDERKQETLDAADRQLKVSPQWREIAALSRALLDEVGQDIELALWLIEAETRLNGAAGLTEAMARLTAMVAAHGLALHPQPEDAEDKPFEMIGALSGMGREGTLIQPLRLMPLVPGGVYGEICLWATQAGQEAAVERALAEAGAAAARQQLDTIKAARAAVETCDTTLTELLGGDAPPFKKIDDTLAEAEGALRLYGHIKDDDDAPAEAEDQADASDTETGGADQPAAPQPGVIRNREDAFEQLLRVARFFRQAEPHSPIADVLETLVRRGRMDFLELLEELIPDPNARQVAMTTAGIGKIPPTNDGGA